MDSKLGGGATLADVPKRITPERLRPAQASAGEINFGTLNADGVILVNEKGANLKVIAGVTLLMAFPLAVVLGVISAVRQNTMLDYVLRVISLSGLSLPSFWLGLLILMACVHYFGWIPIYTTPPKTLWDELLLYSIPAAAVGFRSSALMMRLTRSSMLEVIRLDYIRTARAKGLGEITVIGKHALKAALIPVVTAIGLDFGAYLSGSVLTESIFGLQGETGNGVKIPRPRTASRCRRKRSWTS